jgi:hypothetical protein
VWAYSIIWAKKGQPCLHATAARSIRSADHSLAYPRGTCSITPIVSWSKVDRSGQHFPISNNYRIYREGTSSIPPDFQQKAENESPSERRVSFVHPLAEGIFFRYPIPIIDAHHNFNPTITGKARNQWSPYLQFRGNRAFLRIGDILGIMSKSISSRVNKCRWTFLRYGSEDVGVIRLNMGSGQGATNRRALRGGCNLAGRRCT